MDEIWKPVPGYEGKYEVSNLGRVRSRGARILKHTDNGKGYLYVRFGDGRRVYTHRLVAAVFIGDPAGLEVNHKNGIKGDNRVGNLELVTHSANLQHAYDTGLHPGPNPINLRVVAAFCGCSGDKLAEFPSIVEASGFSKTRPCGISNALAGRQETAGGFIWRYVE